MAERYSFGPSIGDLLLCCRRTKVAVDTLFHHLRSTSRPDFQLSLMCKVCRPRFDTEVTWDWSTVGTDDEGGVAWVAQEWDSLIATDSRRSTFAIISRGLEPEDFARREVMRLFLHHVLDFHRTIGIHGATIGRGTSGVLVTNRGGSGKSTLVLEALRQCYSTTGDDFLLIEKFPAQETKRRVYSFFSNVKIDPASPSARGLEVSSRAGEAKGVIDIERHFPGSLAPSHELAALVVPQLGSATSLVPATAERCLQAILPSSIRLTGKTQALIQTVEDLTRNIPRYVLTVGSDPTEGIDRIAELLLP